MKSPTELYLDHLDRVTKSQATFTQISPSEVHPGVYVAIYRGFPAPDVYTAFTVGLSLIPPAAKPRARHELMIVMRSKDTNWAISMGELAYKHRRRTTFAPNQNFAVGSAISDESSMNCFFTHAPNALSPANACVALPDFNINLVQLYPIYDSERTFIDQHDSAAFLARTEPTQLYQPDRAAIC